MMSLPEYTALLNEVNARIATNRSVGALFEPYEKELDPFDEEDEEDGEEFDEDFDDPEDVYE